MKFTRKKLDTFGGGVEVVYTMTAPSELTSPFAVVASAKGVRMEGVSEYIFGQEELQKFAKILSDAWADHLSLKPNLMEGVHGH